MSLLPSLCAALERANGQRLVMRAGDRPHVLAGDRRHDVASAVLSVNAVEALVDQILSEESRRMLSERGMVEETLNTSAFPHPLTAKAERIGEDFCVELMVRLPESEPAAGAQSEPIVEAEADVAIADIAAEQATMVEPAVGVEDVAPAPPLSPYMPVAPAPTLVAPEPPAPPIVAPEPSIARVDAHPPVRVVTRVEERRVMPMPAAPSRTDLHGLIASAFDRGATTLFLRAGAMPAARINDRIVSIGDGPVPSSVLDEVSTSSARGEGTWRGVSEGEWSCDHDDFGHVTCREFSDDHGHGLVVHLRPRTSPKLLHKYIPRQVRNACEGDGLIVVSTQNEVDLDALAVAIADWSGHTRGGYLIALHRRSGRAEITGAFVSQRTISGTDAEFAAAIRRASHEGPDILLIAGPQNDTVLHEAILASSAGRLVIIAVVAPTAVNALRSTLGQSGLDRDAHVRRVLSSSFRVAVGYRSVRRIGGGRMLVQDIVTSSKEVRALIEMGDFEALVRLQQQGAAGTRSVDDALARASHRGQVSLREAVAHANDRSRLVSLVRMRAHTSAAARRHARTAHEVHLPIAVSQ